MPQTCMAGARGSRGDPAPASRLRPVYRYRNLIAGLPLVPALVLTRFEWESDLGCWGLAAALCVAGVGIRAWARSYNGYGWSRARGLVTDGPYAWVRNPLYWGNTLLILGALVASEVVALVPLGFAVCLGVYHGAARYEEFRLVQRYGEAYLRYRERVPAWIPRRARCRRGAPPFPGRVAAVLPGQLLLLSILLPFALKELGLLAG